MSSLDSVETRVSDLEIGMYVSALDRPWAETPFLMQGFYVASQQDIEELERHCRHVFVDVFRSRNRAIPRRGPLVGAPVTHARLAASAGPAAPSGGGVQFKARDGNAGALLFPHRKLKKYDDAAGGIQKEMGVAKKVHAELSSAVDEMFAEFHSSNVLNVSGVRAAADPMVDSVIRNPDACVWLARMKNEDSYTFRHSVLPSIAHYLFAEDSCLGKRDNMPTLLYCLNPITLKHPFEEDSRHIIMVLIRFREIHPVQEGWI